MSASNNVIIVTGCTKGIGRAIVDFFASKGFDVCGYARNNKDVKDLQHNLEQAYPQQRFLFYSADASKKEDVQAFAAAVKKQFLSVDVLVNNAGVFLPGSIMSENEGTLETLIETNVYSAYYLTRALNGFIKRNIFNICSIASLQAYEAGASYTISKFAMLGFSKQLRHELKGTGVKVTSVMPGAVLTNAWAGVDLPESRFIAAGDIAQLLYTVTQLSNGADVEELVVRPQLGDI